ncbi:replication factor-A protein 1 [Marasmius fiardii PR-910]|nr:replication factor-A protein 1 [Marasmius fiardii PR-910]
MSYELEAGIAERLINAESDDEQIFTTPHTLQILSVKPIGSRDKDGQAPNPQSDRHRVILSDGVHFIQAMLATSLSPQVLDHSITKHTVIVTDKISCNYVQGKRLLILMSVRVLGQCEEKLGNPGNLKEDKDKGEEGSKPASTVGTPAVRKGQPAQQQQQQAAPSKPAGKPNLHPIEALSPYSNNWTIKAMVTQKSDIRTWSNTRGEGKLFNFTLADESGEIRATAFNQVADDLYERIKEQKVYYVSKAKVTLAKKKFNNVQNEYEMTLERNSEVEECTDTTNIPTLKYNFVPLSELEGLSTETICDVIAIAKEVGSFEEFTSNKTQRLTKKRDLTLVDKSGYATRFTMWGKFAENFVAEHDNPVLAIKGARVGDFGGRNLSTINSTQVLQNPELPEAFALRGWYDNQGSEQSFQSHTNAGSGNRTGGGFNRNAAIPLSEVKEFVLGESEKPQFFSSRATVMHIRTDNIAYPACSTPQCNKKVVQNGDSWGCEKCQKSYDEPQWRFIIAMAVSDWTGQEWFQGFNDVGEMIFGKTGNEVVAIRENDEAEFNTLLARSIGHTYNFFCRAKTENFNDTPRVRKGVVRIQKLDYAEESKHLVELLDSPWGNQ